MPDGAYLISETGVFINGMFSNGIQFGGGKVSVDSPPIIKRTSVEIFATFEMSLTSALS